MAQVYDEAVTEHYNKVAEEYGTSSDSTMADRIIRGTETTAILNFVADLAANSGGRRLTIMDVGCGNGYSLKCLAEAHPGHDFVGVEYNDKLRGLACDQTAGIANVRILPGDLRRRDSIAVADGQADAVLCQRVLINLLDPADARQALDNIVSLVRPGGRLLFIEAFDSGLANLNEARDEFGLEPLPPAHHNKYLDGAFFDHPGLKPFSAPFLPAENKLSTHYYVTRVLHVALLKQLGVTELKRNSHFVTFLSAALPDGIGDFAPLRFCAFTRT